MLKLMWMDAFCLEPESASHFLPRNLGELCLHWKWCCLTLEARRGKASTFLVINFALCSFSELGHHWGSTASAQKGPVWSFQPGACSRSQWKPTTNHNEKTFPGPGPEGTLSFQVIPVDVLDIVLRGAVFATTYLNSWPKESRGVVGVGQ